jgi:hypothetical protein
MIMLGTLMPASLGVPAYPLLSTGPGAESERTDDLFALFLRPSRSGGISVGYSVRRKNPSDAVALNQPVDAFTADGRLVDRRGVRLDRRPETAQVSPGYCTGPE